MSHFYIFVYHFKNLNFKSTHMKRSLLFLSALFVAAFTANAQITITISDIASPTTIINQAQDTMPATSLIGSSGVNQTWNMSSLAQHTIDTLRSEEHTSELQ